MGQFVVSTKSEANAMTYAKLLHKYKQITDEPFGEAVLFLAQKLAEEADEELVKKLTDKTFSFRKAEKEKKADTCPLFSETEKQSEFSNACQEKGLDENKLKNLFFDYVLNADKTDFEADVIESFFESFTKREEERENSKIDEYRKICEKEKVTVEQSFRALIEMTVEYGRFPFLFNKDKYTSYEDVLGQLCKSGHVSAFHSEENRGVSDG